MDCAKNMLSRRRRSSGQHGHTFWRLSEIGSIRVIESRRMIWAGYVALMGEMRSA
jgi:hypothetical protein